MKISLEKYDRRRGLTLVELLISVTLLGMITAAASGLVLTVLNAHAAGTEQAAIYREGLQIMDRITREIRLGTHVAIPNAHTPIRNLIAVSGRINEDDDHYFGDDLFPRIDEDPGVEMQVDNKPGLTGIDDDGDGSIDEGGFGWAWADDEDANYNEEIWDGLDDDGDGAIDEDPAADLTWDSNPGIRGMNDDGDGSVDEGGWLMSEDDDEDGALNEDGFNFVVYAMPSAGTLTEKLHNTSTSSVLSTRVQQFAAAWQSPGQFKITLVLQDSAGSSIVFSEVAYARNTLQKTGKRVR